ncbi:MAG: hypothetical protein KAW17_03205 [Candidatus Eisenbacteria sp.]|nr:hypothetical protein [Candidatus Eisenbacteria bacterium]
MKLKCIVEMARALLGRLVERSGRRDAARCAVRRDLDGGPVLPCDLQVGAGTRAPDQARQARWIRARLQAGYYDEPEVRAKIVGALMESLWLK